MKKKRKDNFNLCAVAGDVGARAKRVRVARIAARERDDRLGADFALELGRVG